MAMSAEYRSKFQPFTGHGDVEFKILEWDENPPNKQFKPSIYCDNSLSHGLNLIFLKF